MTSINFNMGASVALQNLRNTNNEMGKVQDQISTGLKVGSAKDNAASWAIATTMASDVSAFKSIGEGLSLAQSTVSIGRKAAESVGEILSAIKDRLVQASGSNVDRATIADEISQLVEQFTTVVEAAQFNGENLLNGTGTMSVLSSLNRDSAGAVTPSYIDVARQDISAAIDLSTIDLTDDTTIATSLAGMDAMIASATDAAAALGAGETRLEIQNKFVSNLADGMEAGISSLVDADMTEASARLKALQTQQQLGVQALSIANQAPQALLTLFR